MTTTAAPSQRFATSGGKGPGAGPGGKGAKDTETDGKSAGGVRALVRSKKFILIVVLLLVAGGVPYKPPAPPTKPAAAVAGDKVKMDATTLTLAGGHYLKVAISIELVKGKAS